MPSSFLEDAKYSVLLKINEPEGKTIKQQKKEYTPIKTYKPSGNLVYDNDILNNCRPDKWCDGNQTILCPLYENRILLPVLVERNL